MDKKLYTEKVVKPEAVSFIIGKNGCHIKDITAKVRNGAYIEYKTDGHKFIVSAYSKESLIRLVNELNNLEKEFELNRKKYAEYRFQNRQVDHSLVTEVIQSMKAFNHSSFVEYKGDNLFVLSNYNLEHLQKMVDKISAFDKPISSSPGKSNIHWLLRRDFKKVCEEIEKLEKENNNTPINTGRKNNPGYFIIMDDNQMEEQIDNYIEKSDSFDEIELDIEDMSYINLLENDFITSFSNFENPYYQLSRDHPPNRRMSDL